MNLIIYFKKNYRWVFIYLFIYLLWIPDNFFFIFLTIVEGGFWDSLTHSLLRLTS